MSAGSLQAALHLAKLGYAIFPMEPGYKDKHLVAWSEEWMTDPADVQEWWARFPGDNIGINCDESALLAIDLDNAGALAAFRVIWYGHSDQEIPAYGMPIIRTRRGWHLYFTMPDPPLRNSASKLAAGIDTRGEGGMVVGPGSQVWHDREHNIIRRYTYTLISGDLGHVPELPVFLEEALRKFETPVASPWGIRPRLPWIIPAVGAAEAKLAHWCARIEGAAEGDQNNDIARAAFHMAHLIPPLSAEEVRGELEDASRRGNHPRNRYMDAISRGLRHRYKEDRCPFAH